MRGFLRIWLALLLCASLTPALAQEVVTLKQAVSYALAHNADVQKARLDELKGKYRTQEVRANALPQLTGSSQLNYNPIVGSLIFGGQKVQIGAPWNSNAAVTLTQQLFNQQVFTGLKAARASERYYTQNTNLTEEQVIENVANLYYQNLITREKVTVIDSNLKNLNLTKRIIDTQFKNGLARKIDVDRIQVNLTNLESDKQNLLTSLDELENQLKFLMGYPVVRPITLPPAELNKNSEQVFPELSDTLDFANRTELKLLDVQRDLLQLQRTAYLAEYYPTLTLIGNYQYSAQSHKFDYLALTKNAVGFDAALIGLQLNVPIFNGFATRSRVRQADVEIKKAEVDRGNTRNALSLQYETAKSTLRRNYNTIQAQERNKELAQTIYNNARNNYNNGLASLTDLIDAENQLTAAQNSYNNALLTYKVSEIQLIKSKGNLKTLTQ